MLVSLAALLFLSTPAPITCADIGAGARAEDGAAWIQKAEQKLYRWPRTEGTLTFEVSSGSLAPGIAAMERDLVKQGDAEGAKLVAALKQLTIAGRIDTRDGALTVDVRVPCDSQDPRTLGVITRIKTMVEGQVRGSIDGLPLRDPDLVPKGGRITGAEESGTSIVVHIEGKDGGARTVEIDRASSLPVAMARPSMRLVLTYGEPERGKFVPTRLEAQGANGQTSRIEFTWQKLDAFLFPERVTLGQGQQSAVLQFRALRFEPAKS